jgi:predicted nucleic acid-binding protein
VSAPFGSGAPLVFDTSAWLRQRDSAVHPRWEATRIAGLLAVCPVVTLEVLRGARDEQMFAALDSALAAVSHQAPVTRTACEAAVGASRQLRGSRRGVPAADYLIVAAAAERGFGVLHCDRHMDMLAETLGVESIRIPGTE